MAAIPKLDEANLQAICDILGDTSTGLTGSEIGRYDVFDAPVFDLLYVLPQRLPKFFETDHSGVFDQKSFRVACLSRGLSLLPILPHTFQVSLFS